MVEVSMSASQNRRVKERQSSKSSKKSFLSRMLRLESLERRELMASDFAPFHNYLASTDVDGDFKISPLDALMVINQLNTTGAGSLASRSAPQTRTGLVDADGDNNLSPLDALLVINSINRGEGIGELAEIIRVLRTQRRRYPWGKPRSKSQRLCLRSQRQYRPEVRCTNFDG
jgi:hypothetical protein